MNFLFFDHSPIGAMLLYETMLFPTSRYNLQLRYSTRAEAIEGHLRAARYYIEGKGWKIRKPAGPKVLRARRAYRVSGVRRYANG